MPSKDRCGPAPAHKRAPFRGPLSLGYASSGASVSAGGVNRALAASATSAVMPQVVFLASAGRVWFARSQPRSRLGSMLSSAARSFGAIVVGVSDKMNPFRLSASHGIVWRARFITRIIHGGLCAARKGLVRGL